VAETRYSVAVVGGGPAGIAAANTAAVAGCRVLLIDAHAALGGPIWRPRVPRPWREALHDVDLLRGATLFSAAFDAGAFVLDLDTADGLRTLRADRLVLATGVLERFLPFPGWTLPGVVGAGAAQVLVKGGFDVRGRRVVVAGSGPLLLAAAALLRRRGARVLAIAEQAPWPVVVGFARGLVRHPGKAVQAAVLGTRLLGVRRLYDAWPVRAEGDGRVERVVLHGAGGQETLACDLLACGFGLVPDPRVASLLGCALAEGAVIVDEWQETSVAGVFAAGETTGVGGAELALAEGRIAGFAAGGRRDLARLFVSLRERRQAFARTMNQAFALRAELRQLATDDTLVCRCEDVPFGAVRACRDRRAAKLATRCGMGPCQGRVCGPALEFLLGWGGDTVRPPIFPVAVETLAAAGTRRDDL